MRRKTEILVIAAVMTVALTLAACGGGSADGGSEAVSSTAGAIADGQTDTQAEGENAATIDGEIVKIETAEDLVAFATKVNEGNTTLNAILENDIDMSGVCGASIGSFVPIEKFEGVFDGHGHTIQNLYCVRSDNAGLINNIWGIVKNLRIENAIVESEEHSAAGIAVAMQSGSSVENCSVSGSIKACLSAAGIVGKLYGDVSVCDCVNEAEVTSTGNYAGGIVSVAWSDASGKISGCTNRGSCTSIEYSDGASGILACNSGSSVQIEDCVDEGAILEDK